MTGHLFNHSCFFQWDLYFFFGNVFADLRAFFVKNSTLGSNSLGKPDVFYDAPEIRSWC
jgi:hypothetical protein